MSSSSERKTTRTHPYLVTRVFRDGYSEGEHLRTLKEAEVCVATARGDRNVVEVNLWLIPESERTYEDI